MGLLALIEIEMEKKQHLFYTIQTNSFVCLSHSHINNIHNNDYEESATVENPLHV